MADIGAGFGECFGKFTLPDTHFTILLSVGHGLFQLYGVLIPAYQCFLSVCAHNGCR